MGGRAAYTLATGIFIGLGGMLGYIAVLSGALPRPALAPILVFIALEIMGQAVTATPARHVAAVLVATLPSLAQLAVIFLAQVHDGALLRAALDPSGVQAATGVTNPAFITFAATTVLVGNGFFITAMLWGSLVAFLIDRRIRAAALTLAIAAVLALFGFIHSVLPTGGIYLPWEAGSVIPYHWAVGYLTLAALVGITPRSHAGLARARGP
jgi:AGZA family xanthine/uracil permease-like MFS transporter